MWFTLKHYPDYEMNNESRQVRHKIKREVLPVRRGQVSLRKQRGKWVYISLSKLMRENRPYDFIKDLADDEEVKPLPSPNEGYFITSKGRFYNHNEQRWLTLTPTTNPGADYHHQVRLRDGPKVVHRLVGQHFLPDFQEHLCVCHTDETLPLSEVHSVSNLWMGTHGENTKDAYAKGRKTWSNQTYKHLLQ